MTPRLTPVQQLDPNVRAKVIDLANRIMVTDRKYHAREAKLKAEGKDEFNIKKDPLLRDMSGATNTLSNMCTALALAFMIAHPDGDPDT